MSDSVKAAFFRVEGVLVRPAPVPPAAFFAARGRQSGTGATRLGAATFAAALRLSQPLKDQPLVHRLGWMALRGLTAPELRELGQTYYHEYLLPALKRDAITLLTAAREAGCRVYLLSEQLDLIVAPLREHLGADVLVANRMEILDGVATGRLLDPLVGPAPSAAWLRDEAAQHGLDLAASRAFGAHHADGLLLSAVGSPCVVDPDWRLRRLAMDQDWPIVHT